MRIASGIVMTALAIVLMGGNVLFADGAGGIMPMPASAGLPFAG